VCQIVAEVGQCSLYPTIAPRAILLSDADRQRSDFPTSWRSARTSTSLARLVSVNQSSVPRQQSFRRGDRRHLPQRLAPSFFALAAKRRRWSSLNFRRRFPICSRRTRFSSIRYAITPCWCRLIHPARTTTTNENGSNEKRTADTMNVPKVRSQAISTRSIL